MRKNFVLDTNVLLHDPRSLFTFEDNTVCIPIVVIEEIDTFKKDATELGRNAREVSRQIDRLRKLGNLTEGVPINEGRGLLRVILTNRDLPRGFRISHQADNRIMATALFIKETQPDTPIIFVTLDTNLRIRANALGITSVDYDTERISIEELYPGVTELEMPSGTVAELFEKGSIAAPKSPKGQWFANEYVMVKDDKSSALARMRPDLETIELTFRVREGVWGIRPRNREQHFALDALLRDDIKLVTLVGKAGTGKTLLALAAGLHKVTEEERYHKLLVSRPIFPLGRDIGYLPGEIEKKLKPWMQPIHDNIEFLMSQNQRWKRVSTRGVQELVSKNVMEIEPLTYIRGRSIPNQYMVVDEAQNLTPHEIKTILTRAGDETKVVFTGDPYQIDNPYIDSMSNGLTFVIQRFKGEKISATVTLRKGERSRLAELAANLL